jgi:S-adenosylmethionine hydrolase
MQSPSAPLVAILSDFGNLDPYVGIMKAVISGIAPQIPLIDISHEIPPGDVARAAFVLWQSLPFLPPGSICLCVVDPGVGTSRAPICYDGARVRVIAPDNGLLTYILGPDPQVHELANPEFQLPERSTTFHGRDIFAPAAGHAALGVPGKAFGPRIKHPVRIPLPKLDISPNRVTGQTLHADHFGNVLTSLGSFTRAESGWRLKSWLTPQTIQEFSSRLEVRFRGEGLPLGTTFAEIPSEKVGAIVGSTGLLEIVANGDSAKNRLNISAGEPVELRGING